jgi:TetR/AcrR family transcriptional repressor of bet genes
MGRPSNTAERRAQIADALLAVMAERGYEQATIERIAEKANLAPGLLHYHFGTKAEILAYAVERLTLVLRARIDARLTGAGTDPRRRLHAVLEAFLALGDDASSAAVASWSALSADASRVPDVRALYARGVAESVAVIEDAVRGVLRAEQRTTRRADEIARTVICAVEGCFRLGGTAAVPAGAAIAIVSRMTDALLAAQPTRH